MQLGRSESARFSTAEEARFRIPYPNSKPRQSRIIALDAASEATLRSLATRSTGHARFFRYVESKGVSDSLQMLHVDALLEDLNGNRASLVDEVEGADIVVMLITAGVKADAAEVIGTACFVRNKTITGLVLDPGAASEEDAASTLTAMRPYAPMLVVSGGADYVEEMLHALRV